MAVEQLVEGSTYRLRLVAQDNGAVLDLTGATVTLSIAHGHDPDDVVVRSCTIESAGDGTAYYDAPTTEFDADLSRWRLKWRVVKGSLDVKSRWIDVTVVA